MFILTEKQSSKQNNKYICLFVLCSFIQSIRFAFILMLPTDISVLYNYHQAIEPHCLSLHVFFSLSITQNVNVIVVDWQTGAKGPNYFQAAANTRVVGADIATLILTAQSLGAAASSFHIIGHSLGSHIAGYAGEKVHGMGRITGGRRYYRACLFFKAEIVKKNMSL